MRFNEKSLAQLADGLGADDSPLSAQLRRPRPRSAASAIRRHRPCAERVELEVVARKIARRKRQRLEATASPETGAR